MPSTTEDTPTALLVIASKGGEANLSLVFSEAHGNAVGGEVTDLLDAEGNELDYKNWGKSVPLTDEQLAKIKAGKATYQDFTPPPTPNPVHLARYALVTLNKKPVKFKIVGLTSIMK